VRASTSGACQWTPKKDASVCMQHSCATKFGLTHYRHHCRMCGAVVCDACSRARVSLPELSPWAQRVCKSCMPVHTLAAPFSAPLLVAGSPASEAVGDGTTTGTGSSLIMPVPVVRPGPGGAEAQAHTPAVVPVPLAEALAVPVTPSSPDASTSNCSTSTATARLVPVALPVVFVLLFAWAA
jgi:hypothetical protein